jgi:Tfp pilus assembly PilM family ATPase
LLYDEQSRILLRASRLAAAKLTEQPLHHHGCAGAIMATRADNVSGVEITRDNISVAQYSSPENTVVNASVVVSPLDDEDASTDLVSSLRTKFKKLAAQMHCEGQPAAVAVPSNFAVVKNVMLDSDEEDVREAIGWELGQHIVGTMDDYSFDFEPLAGDADGSRHFLAVAYRKANVRKLVSLLKTGRLSPRVVDLDMFALVDALEANYRENTAAPSLIIHGCSDSSKLILTANGAFLDFDVVEHRAGHTAADAYASQLQEIIARNLPASRRPRATFVTGPLFANPDFCEEVCSRLGNALLLDPFKAIRSTVAIPKDDLVKCVPYLAVAVGLALRCAAEADA